MKILPKVTKQLLFIFLILVMSGVMVGNYYASRQLQAELSLSFKENYQQHEVQIAQAVSRSLENEVRSIQEKLIILSRISEIRSTESETCNQELKIMFETLERKIGNLGRVNSDGYFVCSLNEALIGVDARTLGAYINTILEDPEHKPVMSRSIKPAGLTGYVVAVHVPVYDEEGNFDGTLGGAIYFDQLEDKYLKEIKLGNNGHIVLLDDDGTVLYHPYNQIIGTNINSDIFKSYASTQVYKEIIDSAINGEVGSRQYLFDRLEKVGSFTDSDIFPGRKWIVLVTIPLEDIENAPIALRLESLFKTYILINAGIIVLSSFLLMFFILSNIKQQETLDRLKDEFVSIASHELRTPMTAIKGLISMIYEGDFGKVPAKLKEPLGDIAFSTNRLINLVNDLLNVSRIEAKRMKFNISEFSPSSVIEPIVNSLHPLVGEKNVKLEISEIPQDLVVGDVEKVHQILNNILGNSIKFTDSGSITVSGVKNGELLNIYVTDTGIGISPQNQQKLFSKFQQVSSQKAGRPAGTGLGLYISRELARKMGGDLWIEKSQEGIGTTFGYSIALANSSKANKIKKIWQNY